MTIEYTYKNEEFRVQIDNIQIFPSSKILSVTGFIINKSTFETTPYSYSLEGADFRSVAQTPGTSSKNLGQQLIQAVRSWIVNENKIDEMVVGFKEKPGDYVRPTLIEK